MSPAADQSSERNKAVVIGRTEAERV